MKKFLIRNKETYIYLDIFWGNFWILRLYSKFLVYIGKERNKVNNWDLDWYGFFSFYISVRKM